MIKDTTDKLESLYKRYNGLMYSVAYRILNDHQLAQDAVQMSFVKAMDNIEKILDVECNKTKIYMVIICRNISINIYNKRKRNSPVALEEIDQELADNTDIVDQLISMENLLDMKVKIKALNRSYADIIALKYTLGYSEKEIAGMLDISEKNVRVRLHRARNSLMKILSEEGGEVI